MAAGLPIISYDDPRMNGIYDEVACFRVARISRLELDIVQHWQELGSDSDLRNQLGRAGRQAHLEKYCWEKQFEPIARACLEYTK